MDRLECYHHGRIDKVILIDDEIEYPCCILEFLKVNSIKCNISIYR